MSIISHVTHLEDKHEHLEALIAVEFARPMPDLTVINGLKKQKLALKDEINACIKLIPKAASS